MLWLIQNDFYNNDDQARLELVLSRYGLSYKEVDIHSISNIRGCKNTIICGGNALSRLAKDRGWEPGSFLNNNFAYDKWISAYGSDMLNSCIIKGKLSEVNPAWDKIFIRPYEDNKAFTGCVLRQEEFKAWKSIMADRYNLGNTQVIASKSKQIFAEYRFFIIDKEIVAHSQYRMSSNAVAIETVSIESYNFVSKLIKQWNPARAFVIDVADTEDGLKVIELNNINSAGFYGCNIGKIVEALETMQL